MAFLENLNFNIKNIVRAVPYSVLISIPKGQPKVMEMPGIRSKYPKFVDNKNSYVGFASIEVIFKAPPKF